MALEAGTKLGPYEILSPLGAGGMGEEMDRVNFHPRELVLDVACRTRIVSRYAASVWYPSSRCQRTLAHHPLQTRSIRRRL